MSIPYYDCIAHHAMRRPDSLAAVDLATGRQHTYQAFNERIARLAGSFRRNFEIAAGDRVAVLAPNTTDTFEVQFACGRLGAIFVPLNWRLANPELRAILADCTPTMLVYDPEFADRAEDLARSLRYSAGWFHSARCSSGSRSTDPGWTSRRRRPWMTSRPFFTPPARPDCPRARSSRMA